MVTDGVFLSVFHFFIRLSLTEHNSTADYRLFRDNKQVMITKNGGKCLKITRNTGEGSGEDPWIIVRSGVRMLLA